jgi:signal recognition particle GTPase
MRTASTQTEYSKLTASSDDDDDEQPPTAVYWQRKYEQACREYRFYASQKSQALRIAQLRNAKLERLVERLQKQLHEAEADITVARERLTRLRREHQRLRTWVLENGLTLSPLQKLERESPSP